MGTEIANSSAYIVCNATADIPNSHAYEGWVFTDESIHTQSCIYCAYYETNPHYGNQVITQNPTCTIRGKAESTCVECGYLYDVVDLGTQWDAHTWNEGKITIEPNCGQEGVKDITCLECGMTKSEILPIVGEHNYDAGKVLQESTCLYAGIRVYTCTVCGWAYDEPIEIAAHTWGDGIQNTDGTVTYFCTVCDHPKTEGTPTEAPQPTTQPAPVVTQPPTTVAPTTPPATTVPMATAAPTTAAPETTVPTTATTPVTTSAPETTVPVTTAAPTQPPEAPSEPASPAPVIAATAAAVTVCGGGAYLWFFQKKWLLKLLTKLAGK